MGIVISLVKYYFYNLLAHRPLIHVADVRANEAKDGDFRRMQTRDQEKASRSLYNVQCSLNLDVPLILAYDIFAQPTDAGTLGPMLARQRLFMGRLPKHQRADAGYATALALAVRHNLGVTLYVPIKKMPPAPSRAILSLQTVLITTTTTVDTRKLAT